MTDKSASRGDMTPEVQIKCAIEEGMENIACAIFGENLDWHVEYGTHGVVLTGVELYGVRARHEYAGYAYAIAADVPIRHPDATCGSFRIDDTVFAVKANDWAASFVFKAWCEHNPYNGAGVIVKQSRHDMPDRWLVANSDDGVLYRGNQLPPFVWAKDIIKKKWPWPHAA